MKKTLILMILSLYSVLGLSQTINTYNPKTKTLTIDSTTIENVDKGLRNEKLLRKKRDSLILIIKEKDRIIQLKDEKIDTLIKTVGNLGNRLVEIQTQQTEISDTQLKVEKRKSNYGFYTYAEVGTGLSYDYQNKELNIQQTENYRHFSMGLEYVANKILVGIGVNPVNEKPVYQIKFGIKIF